MLVKRDPINIVEVILDLRRHPHRMKFRQIASAIGVTVDMVKGWFYDSAAPRFDDGLALLQLHRLKTESGFIHQHQREMDVKPASHTRVTAKPNTESPTMSAKKTSKPKKVVQPGESPGAGLAAQAPGESDPDAAIEQVQSGGGARRIARPRAAVPPAKVNQVDSLRPKAMPVNQKTEMSYEDAMKLHKSGEQTRAILTPQGWLAPPMKTPQHAKAGVA
jgi:hypothetical protein